MRTRLVEPQEIEKQVQKAPDQEISLTDPDPRAMATNMREASTVGYNVQAAVDTEHHLIIAHEVTNVAVDRTLLASMAAKSKAVMRADTLEALVDRSYYSGEQLLACEQAGIKPYVPKPRTSNARAEGRFDKEDFLKTDTPNDVRWPTNGYCSGTGQGPVRAISADRSLPFFSVASEPCDGTEPGKHSGVFS